VLLGVCAQAIMRPAVVGAGCCSCILYIEVSIASLWQSWCCWRQTGIVAMPQECILEFIPGMVP
jgi:hypothetical protein